ncbi:MAG: GNAT family protein [Nanoarchaeota archaeon]
MKFETKRLILRKPRISDWKDIVKGVGEISVSKSMSVIPYPYLKKNALMWIKKYIKDWEKKKGNEFLIELKENKKVVGCISLIGVDKFNGTAGTGSWINKRYWRKGYITEAKIAVNNFAFNRLKLRKLDSKVFTDNLASNKTQQSMGYKLEGCRKKGTRSKATGKIHDVNIYGLFKENWKKNLLKIKKKLNEKIKKLEK